ncbi:ATP-binding cassette domain-containing protein [Kallotenue papyrolyticum]|uniref:ATP-binding cassette domain-containing protein n=1 Tax=Kallotenue papyrolyticum TaxID=1325125 RepID=UPI0004785ED6|nr:ABC transporter ATP-binding protein [Kallotenue papyrolyticum]
MAEPAIYVSNVHKSYGSLRVLTGVDLAVERGEVFGLLGPNGAGKTTLIHIILGLLRPDDGVARVLGADDRERVSARIGYLPERPRYHQHFTAREYLKVLGQLSDLRGPALATRVDEVLELVGLSSAADRRIGGYSKGMLQRLGLAQAVLHRPDLLIVDEPTSGLDPAGQRETALLLEQLGATGQTIFLCSHRLNEVAHLCRRVGVLAGGRIRRVARMEELHAQGRSVVVRVGELPLESATALSELGPAVRCERHGVRIFPATEALINRVLRQLLDDGVAVQAVVPDADALEQFYLDALQEHAAPHADHQQELLQTLIEDR